MRHRSALILLLLMVIMLASACGIFAPRYELITIAEPEGGGTVERRPDDTEFPEGTEVSLTAVPAAGWSFDSWEGVDSDTAEAVVLMDAHRQVSAVFRPELSLSNPYNDITEAITEDFSPLSDDSWTFMIYLDGDNDLEPAADADFSEIEAGVSAANNPFLEVIVLFDRRDDGAADVEWQDSRYYRINSSGTTLLLEPGELNMGDPATLSDFMNYSVTNYGADHYALLLWNHGGGARSVTPSASTADLPGRQLCIDEYSSGDSLYLDEVQQAVSDVFSNSSRLDLLGIDACNMGTIETAYEFRNLADYFAASMSSVSYDGWDYATLFGGMAGGSAADAESLAKLIVAEYAESTAAYDDQSIAAVNLSGMESLKTAVDSLAVSLYETNEKAVIEQIRNASVFFYDYNYDLEAIAQPYHDLNDLCCLVAANSRYLGSAASDAAEAVLTGLGTVVVAAYAGDDWGGYMGYGDSVKRGLSIFFSNGDRLYDGYSHYSYQYWYTAQDISMDYNYGNIDFCNSDEDEIVEGWRELMEAWYDPYRPPVGWTPGAW